MIEVRGNTKSFLLLFVGMTIVAVLLSALPTAADVYQNQQSEFCVLMDGRELKNERTGDCVFDTMAIAGRFLFYFAYFGGALLGPFGLYLIMLGLKAGLGKSKRIGTDGGIERSEE